MIHIEPFSIVLQVVGVMHNLVRYFLMHQFVSLLVSTGQNVLMIPDYIRLVLLFQMQLYGWGSIGIRSRSLVEIVEELTSD